MSAFLDITLEDVAESILLSYCYRQSTDYSHRSYIFWSPFLDIVSKSMPAVSFLVQLSFKILNLQLHVFWIMV